MANRGAVVANRGGDGGGASGVGCVALSPLGAVMLLVARLSRQARRSGGPSAHLLRVHSGISKQRDNVIS